MRLFLLLLLTGWAVPYTYRYEMAACPTGANPGMCIAAQPCSAGVCNGIAPSGPSEGMQLYGVAAYRLTTCAAVGQTLGGVGTLLAYRYDGAEGVWIRNPSLNQAVSASGERCQVFPDFVLPGNQSGRVRFVASGVTVSDGTTLDVLLEGYGVAR